MKNIDLKEFEKILTSLKKQRLISNKNKITKKGSKLYEKILREY
tara:strand:- start:807 stop:938 length:132 start_codon:yes stop_codon:yes gene_type:complete